jgi:hypothetical protein
MKVLSNGIKIRNIEICLEKQTIDIIYEKGIAVKILNITIESAEEINFIDFKKLNKIL